jgi:hypothetical protein
MLAWSASPKLGGEFLNGRAGWIMEVPLELFKRSIDRRADAAMKRLPAELV